MYHFKADVMLVKSWNFKVIHLVYIWEEHTFHLKVF